MTKPDGWDFRNKEMQILKRELQMLCDEEKEMAREKTARQQLVIRLKPGHHEQRPSHSESHFVPSQFG